MSLIWFDMMIGHLIIMKLRESFAKTSGHPNSMTKPTQNEPEMNNNSYFPVRFFRYVLFKNYIGRAYYFCNLLLHSSESPTSL